MKASVFKKGQSVKIYADPITCKTFEGTATLLSCIDPEFNPEYEYWNVRFSDGMNLARFVNKTKY
jgi:hypothetical protein